MTGSNFECALFDSWLKFSLFEWSCCLYSLHVMSLPKRPASNVSYKRPAALRDDVFEIEPFTPYCLVKRPCLPKMREDAPDFQGIEYSVMRRKRARDATSEFGKPLSLDPRTRSKESDEEAANASDKWDLHLWLGKKHNHAYYHRLVGLTTNLVCWGKYGRRLSSPYIVPSDRWHEYAVHHIDWDSKNVAQSNLAPMLDEDHRSLLHGQRLQGKLLQRT